MQSLSGPVRPRAAASRSSVDGAPSSNVYGENQKPGGAGRKETKEYEKCKWEKGNGSTGGPNDDHRAPPGGKDGGGEEDKCPICMDDFTNEEKLSCGHSFCKDCLRRSVESMGATCPVCKDVFGKVVGDQPDGTIILKSKVLTSENLTLNSTMTWLSLGEEVYCVTS